MFTKTAEFYDALYSFKDYQAACDQLHRLIQKHNPVSKTLLDVACGSGKHISYLRDHYDIQGLDINKELLAVAKKRCPEIQFHAEDMSDFNLGETFDVVACLFSSIGYVRTLENLNRAVRCMVNHLNPGGLLVIEPWFTPDQFWAEHIAANFTDKPGLKIAWMYAHQKIGNESVLDIHYMVGTTSGIETFTEQHILGLWTKQEYVNAFNSSGIQVQYDQTGLFGRGMYTGIKK